MHFSGQQTPGEAVAKGLDQVTFLELLLHARIPVEVSGMKTPVDRAGYALLCFGSTVQGQQENLWGWGLVWAPE